MSLAITYCRAQYGMDAPLVTVETHLSNGLPAFNIVGMAETAVKESKDRVRSALINSHFEFPQRKITINLAPAELPKQGSRYDLAIAIGILAASKQLAKQHLDEYEFLGELSLSGELRAVNCALSAALQTKSAQRSLIFPKDNRHEVSLSQHDSTFYAQHLLEISAHLQQHQSLPQTPMNIIQPDAMPNKLLQVQGHASAKQALSIVAAGRHNLLMAGPPGSGKTLLANCLPGLLPPMNFNEAIETANIFSIDGITTDNFFARPFCAPHHNASPAALIGGGNPPKPGEISRAHNGVLFLDEMPEFHRNVLEMLREPLEKGEITINRAAHKIKFLSKFILVAAMNLCPCGFHLSDKHCRCTPDQIQRYQSKISGPLLDRIDMQLFIRPIRLNNIVNKTAPKQPISAENIKQRIIAAHNAQIQRQGKNNANLSHQEIETFCRLSANNKRWYVKTIEQLKLSMRAYHRTLKVARTIADLNTSVDIEKSHLEKALSFRNSMFAK